MTNHHRLNGLNNKRLFLIVLEAGNRFAVGRGPTSCFVDDHLLSVTSRGRRGDGALWGPFDKGTNPIPEGSTLMPSSLPRDPSSKYHHIGVRTSTYKGRWGTKKFSLWQKP